MTPHRGAAALLLSGLALALAACGTQDSQPAAERSAKIPVADLAVMVLPQEELGALADGLRVSVDDSGPTNNLDAADDTLDPGDTARSLKSAGRIAGYDLAYVPPKASKRQVAVSVGTTADLFTDPVYATQHLSKQVSDFDRFMGKVVDGVRLVAVKNFKAVGVGEEASGLQVTVVAGKARAHATVVYFRRGRLVGIAWAIRRDKRSVLDDVRRVALTLDTRMQRVLAGQADEEPVPLPGKPTKIDPKPFVLKLEDLSPGATATGEGYRQHGEVASFLREFKLRDNKLGDSTIAYLRSMTQVFGKGEDAAGFLRAIELKKVELLLARTFVRGVVKSKVTGLRVRPLPVAGRDTAGAVFTFKLLGQPVKAVLFCVQSGRLLGSVTALGPADEIHTADVLALVPQVRARLDATG